MKSFSKKYFLVLVLLLVSSAISWNLYFKEYSQKDTIDIHAFPKQIGEWTSEDLPITEDEYAILETRNAVARRYIRPDKKFIYFYIVYSQNNRKVSHPPEICYTGGGVSILGSEHDFIPVAEKNILIDTNKLFLEMGEARQILFYWFKVGDTFTPNYWKQQALIAIKSLFGRPASSAMIRLSADVIDGDEGQTTELLKEFTQLIVPELFKYLP